jgi:hypothetical protein
MAEGATHTINLPSGEPQQVTPVYSMIGQLIGYDVYAITPTGDLRLVHSKVGEHNYQEKQEGGFIGGITRAMHLDDRSIIEKYNREAHLTSHTEALQRDKDLYLYREKNIKEMAMKPDGLLWEAETGSIKRVDNYTAVKLLNDNIARAVKQGVFGKPNDKGLYYDPANPQAPPMQLPQYSINNLATPGVAPTNSAYNQPEFFGVSGKPGAKPQATFAGSKPKRFGRLFGSAAGGGNTLDLDNSGVMSIQSGTHNEAALEDILRSQMTRLGANPNITPNDPFFLSYAYRRSRPELNQQILLDEQCDMTIHELVNYYRNVELKEKQVITSNYDNNPLTGVTMMIEEPSTRAQFYAKQVNPTSWGGKEVEIVRRLISTGPYVQAFQGFFEEPKSKNLMAIFEKPRMTIYDYLKTQTMTDDLFKKIFSTILRALCHLESIGLHHPDITDNALKLIDNDFSTLRLSNPFTMENYYQEIITVYLNNFNTVHGIAAFNKRYLQENIMELFCCLMTVVLRTNFSTYSPSMGQFNGPEILKGIENVRRMCSPYVADLLSRYLNIPIDKMPTPIQLATQEGVMVDYNSYYGHSKLNRPLYYPFEKFTGMKKAPSNQVKVNPPPFSGRIPHWSEIDYYKGDDLNESRVMGIAYRKKNFVVEEGNVNKSLLKPYNITLRDVELNENVLLGHNESYLGNKQADRYQPPREQPTTFTNQVAQRPPQYSPPVAQAPSPTYENTRVIGGGGVISPNDSPIQGLSPILGPNPNNPPRIPLPVPVQQAPEYRPAPPQYQPSHIIQGKLGNNQVPASKAPRFCRTDSSSRPTPRPRPMSPPKPRSTRPPSSRPRPT